MVCTFFFIVLPALVCRALYWVFGFFTGIGAAKKTDETKKDAGAKQVEGSGCPYHALLKFFGFQVPEKKQVAPVADAAAAPETADKTVKAE